MSSCEIEDDILSEVGAQMGKTLRLDVSECSDLDEEEVMQQNMRSTGLQGN